MNFPVTVSKNTYFAYKSAKEIEQNRKIKAENFKWNFNHPKSLVEICIEKLSINWTGLYIM